ncbi:tRNA (adenine(58)-N(1))-methyltransferase non-catalytic subunit TRM6 [Eumeta japonica]|uniref:tRNA (adenine(58)-N(1))-methyltransferase non-catalytic subunit TRM6 n=1 Tax=Eumeta variegata TaxID=151549 RepID=A0A4C1TDA2_EUMVA|nr:tRNA (adenine(58)-N(1))-methyltransferase non-catalytic subunit TRM6 [Eumeta japonica]
MLPKDSKKNRMFSLELTNVSSDLRNEINIKTSGTDNRNIFDDGKSQKLSAGEIEELKNDTNSASDIVGNHLLYDSGSNGLIAATLLSVIGSQTKGKLIHMHPGNMSQKQAILAMNFDQEQLERCISVNAYSALRQYYQGCDHNDKEMKSNDIEHNSKCEINAENPLKRSADIDLETECAKKVARLSDVAYNSTDNCESNTSSENSQLKKPKWHFDNIAAAEVLKNKMDSLVIACKEDPLNIFRELLPFIKPGRPFVVYYSIAEPLQHMYLALKSQSNVAALKLTCNWMRNYQVLPERTHPDVTMNASSGFLLSGYVLK